jgi:hypothetical protein
MTAVDLHLDKIAHLIAAAPGSAAQLSLDGLNHGEVGV